MARHDARLAQVIERFRSRKDRGGGWGEDSFPGAPVSIVNTSEVLAIFKHGRVPARDPDVRSAIAFVEDAVAVHPLPVGSRPGARGPNSRYAAFGLLALTLFREDRVTDARFGAQSTCLAWLDDHELPEGGWSSTPLDTPQQLSVVSTAAAIQGLDRVDRMSPSHQLARRLAAEAREAFAAAHQPDDDGAWWSQRADAVRPSPSATALAVLALQDGDDDQRELARAGADWLYAHRRRWMRETEPDLTVKGANWRLMAYSLGLRALLGPAGRRDPSDRKLRPAIEFLESLWHEEEAGWSHGSPAAAVTPSGCVSAVLAADAIRRALRLDLARMFNLQTAPAPSKPHPRRLVNVSSEGVVEVFEPKAGGDVKIASRRFPPDSSQFRVLKLLAERHRDAEELELKQVSLTTEDLRRALAVDESDSVRRTLERVNRALRENTAEGESLPELVQRVTTDKLPHVRWRIDAEHVSVS